MSIVYKAFFYTPADYLREVKGVISAENIRVNGIASVLIKGLSSALVIALTAKVTMDFVNSSQIVVAAALASLGLFVLLKIVNYSLGVKAVFACGKEGLSKEGTFVKGHAIFPDGCSQEGYFVEKDLIIGTFVAHKEVRKGVFKDDVLVQGKVTFFNEDFLEGYFVDLILIEGTSRSGDCTETGTFDKDYLLNGTKTFDDGTQEEGTFKDGVLVNGTRKCQDGKLYKVETVDFYTTDDSKGKSETGFYSLKKNGTTISTRLLSK